MCGELERRITDELRSALLFRIPVEKAHFYEDEFPFGEAVVKAFPSTTYDIEEAARCYASGRNTACVMHIARVLEVALKAIGADLQVQGLGFNPSWESILGKIDDELRRRHAQQSLGWPAIEPFYSEAAAFLRCVKVAWRNPSMHVDRSYDEEKAGDILRAGKSFMQHLATKLHE